MALRLFRRHHGRHRHLRGALRPASPTWRHLRFFGIIDEQDAILKSRWQRSLGGLELTAALGEARILQGLSRSAAAVAAGADVQETLDGILAAVQDLGFERVRLFLLSPDQQSVALKAQHGSPTDLTPARPAAEDM